MGIDRENIQKNNSGPVLLLLSFSLMLLLWLNSSSGPAEKENNAVSSDYALHQELAVFNPAVNLPIFQKNWISIPNDFKHLPGTSPLLIIIENRKVDISISLLRNIQQNLDIVPVFIHRYHLFAPENDETPLLG